LRRLLDQIKHLPKDHKNQKLVKRLKAYQVSKGLLLAPLKKRPRTLFKVAFKYRFDTRLILDFVRCSIVFKKVEGVYQGLYNMCKKQADYGFEIIRIKDRFRSGQEDGYRDILVNIRLPSGVICEVQLQQAELNIMKKEGHKAYNKVREIIGLENVISGLSSKRRVLADNDTGNNLPQLIQQYPAEQPQAHEEEAKHSGGSGEGNNRRTPSEEEFEDGVATDLLMECATHHHHRVNWH
jgi:hypothetical protein